MYVIKVLKRKDAASVVIAIWLAMQLMQLTTTPTSRLIGKITGLGDSGYQSYGGYGGGWRNEYLYPFVSFVVQLIALEILIRVFTFVHPLVVRKKK